jgi:uncharacterized membrane protein YhaH (DUF805 family)
VIFSFGFVLNILVAIVSGSDLMEFAGDMAAAVISTPVLVEFIIYINKAGREQSS